jgi:hypothetical protein
MRAMLERTDSEAGRTMTAADASVVSLGVEIFSEQAAHSACGFRPRGWTGDGHRAPRARAAVSRGAQAHGESERFGEEIRSGPAFRVRGPLELRPTI